MPQVEYFGTWEALLKFVCENLEEVEEFQSATSEQERGKNEVGDDLFEASSMGPGIFMQEDDTITLYARAFALDGFM
ncbi:hypothetical protein AVEN_230286-1 [Araneus ventricosus]|uniref:Uncharacterized protein n=1 Tax=Araneus ventricosus TaxID=182803 RepID=A0A4Y2LAH2_ARAVE|nr:hypothetical protein AVEN_230286-1 [Araneus ventricosus]